MEFHHCHVSERAIELVTETLRSGRLSEGVKVKEFESKLWEMGLRNPICLNSGTSAIHLALVLAGVKPEDEVILPAQTFIATGMAVLQVGATPVFADIDPNTGNICPESVRKKLTHRTAAIIVVHWGGLPASLEDLDGYKGEKTCAYRIEDAAHALGAMYKNTPIGDCGYSDFTAFSFQATKHLTTSDGGCLCCMWHPDHERGRKLRWFGLDREVEVGSLGERECDVSEVGYKTHLNDLAASLGLGNLSDFPERLKRRQEIGKRYREELDGARGVKLLRLDPDRTHAYYFFSLLVERREDFVKTMKKKEIPVSVVNRRIDRYSVFGGLDRRTFYSNRGQEVFDDKHIAIPCHEGLSNDDVTQVIESVRGGW